MLLSFGTWVFTGDFPVSIAAGRDQPRARLARLALCTREQTRVSLLKSDKLKSDHSTADHYRRVLGTVSIALLLTALAVMAITCFVLAKDAFLLLFLAILFAVFLVKSANFASRHLGLNYGWSLAGVVLLLFIISGGSAVFFGTAIEQQLQATSKQMEDSMQEFKRQLQDRPYTKQALSQIPFAGQFLEIDPQQETMDGLTEALPFPEQGQVGDLIDAASPVTERVFPAFGQMLSSTFGLFTGIAIVFFVGLFLAIDPLRYRDGFVRLVPDQARAKATVVCNEISDVLFAWLGGRLLTMLITGGGTALGLWLFGVPLPLTIGTITALLTFIPNIGAVLALLLAMLMALPQGPGTVLWVVAMYCLLQLVESNVITPLIQASRTSIPPALLIAFQLVFGLLTGFLGLMVATPLLATIMVIVEQVWVQEVVGEPASEA